MAEPKLVYVIDDDTALCAAYSAALNQRGFIVKTASDGSQGASLLKNTMPDAILLDILMPNLDGLEFLRQLRNSHSGTDVKVVVVSNFESPAGIAELGVTKYLSKMQNTPEAVAEAVDRVLAS